MSAARLTTIFCGATRVAAIAEKYGAAVAVAEVGKTVGCADHLELVAKIEEAAAKAAS